MVYLHCKSKSTLEVRFMALDGIAVRNIVFELNNKLLGGRIDKVYQPRKDELIISVRSIGENFKLLLSANANNPRAQITSFSKENPANAPLFCMVLRKHIMGNKIINIYQPDFERVIVMETSGLNELSDTVSKKLIIEIMGKHSNIILVDEKGIISDSIKHISYDTSSVREVLPGKEYFAPPSQMKINPLSLTPENFNEAVINKSSLMLSQIIYLSYTGISPIMASEICHRSGFDASIRGEHLSQSEIKTVYNRFLLTKKDIENNCFAPEIVYGQKGEIIDFFSVACTQLSDNKKVLYPSISELLEEFYTEKDSVYHMKQKSHDIRKLVVSNIERCVKKKEIQAKLRKDNQQMETWRLKGELITSNIHAIEVGTNTFRTINYYDENMGEIEIAIDPTLTPSQNAQRYFNKYNKAKRALVAVEIQEKQNNEDLEYLESVLVSIDTATDEADLKDIRNELMSQGFIKYKHISIKEQRKQKKSAPSHYISSDGYDIYVGKNNVQNDCLTIKFAKGNDTWLHTKNIPGSHVIVCAKSFGEEIPDNTLLEAANLAAFNSKGKTGSKIPVDYCPKRNVKKPNGAKPGMVIYANNKTIYVTPDEQKIKDIKKQN